MPIYYWKSQAEETMEFDPRLRKATELMRMLNHGLNPLFSNEDFQVDKKKTQVILGSFHGEIDPTLNFLKGYATRDLARPFLFQNSLHHSTTGFVSQQFQLLGPSYSICLDKEGQKEILLRVLTQACLEHRPSLAIHAECFPMELAEISEYKEENFCEILFFDQQVADGLSIARERGQESQEIENFVDLNNILNSDKATLFHIKGYWSIHFSWSGQEHG